MAAIGKATGYARNPEVSPDLEAITEFAKRLECARIPPL
jgi:hypothetical protein